MQVEIKYGNKDSSTVIRGEVVGESNEPVTDDDGKLLYSLRTIHVKIPVVENDTVHNSESVP